MRHAEEKCSWVNVHEWITHGMQIGCKCGTLKGNEKNHFDWQQIESTLFTSQTVQTTFFFKYADSWETPGLTTPRRYAESRALRYEHKCCFGVFWRAPTGWLEFQFISVGKINVLWLNLGNEASHGTNSACKSKYQCTSKSCDSWWATVHRFCREVECSLSFFWPSWRKLYRGVRQPKLLSDLLERGASVFRFSDASPAVVSGPCD